MFARLTGRLAETFENQAVIDVGGVGYLVACSARTLEDLRQKTPGGPGAESGVVTVLIETQVREDAINLFGFSGQLEKEWFHLLNSVQGVSGKIALSLLSTLSPNDLSTAIAAQDKTMLTRADGVGPKLAARLINELEGKVASFVTSSGPGKMTSATGGAGAAPSMPTVVGDAVSALVNLGFGRAEAFAAVNRVAANMDEPESQQIQSLISAGLKELSA